MLLFHRLDRTCTSRMHRMNNEQPRRQRIHWHWLTDWVWECRPTDVGRSFRMISRDRNMEKFLHVRRTCDHVRLTCPPIFSLVQKIMQDYKFRKTGTILNYFKIQQIVGRCCFMYHVTIIYCLKYTISNYCSRWGLQKLSPGPSEFLKKGVPVGRKIVSRICAFETNYN